MKNSIKRFSVFLLTVFSVCIMAALAACGQDEPTKPIAELIIASPPAKTTYIQGEKFDRTGLKIDAEFIDGTTQKNVKYTITPNRPLQPSDTYVFANYGGEQVSIKIQVILRGNQDKYSVENTPTDPTSPLKGKTYFFLGSSVTLGSAADEQSMADFIAKRNDCTVIKEAVSGTTLFDMGYKSYVKRLEDYILSDEKAPTLDAFICQLSTNDTKDPDKFGTVTAENVKDKSAFDKATTFGAIEYIIAVAKETWDCDIMFYTNSYYENADYAQMVTALKQIAAKWNIKVLDLYTDSQFNDITAQDRELYMSDDIHPTKAGYREWWTPMFEAELRKL